MRVGSDGRWAALAGVGFVVLTLVGDLLAGMPPKFDASSAKIVVFFLDHHRTVLAGVVLTGVASGLLVWLIAGLAVRLRAIGQETLGTVVLAGGVAGAALGAAADVVYGALAQIAIGGSPTFVRGGVQL